MTRISTFLAVAGALLLPGTCLAAYRVQCENPGLCQETLCVKDASQAGMACQVECGNRARTKSVRKASCSPAK